MIFKRRRHTHLVAADTIALLIFTVISGLPALFYELLLVGFTLGQWAIIRLLYNTLRFAGARLCGKLTDLIRRRLAGSSSSYFRKGAADTVSLLLYQLPLYLLSALIVGANVRQMAIALAMYLFDSILLGWLYGAILDRVRLYFAARAGRTS